MSAEKIKHRVRQKRRRNAIAKELREDRRYHQRVVPSRRRNNNEEDINIKNYEDYLDD